LTDLYGDVPYAEAFRGRASGVTKPGYDAQEDIYLAEGGILDNLERAIAAMDTYQGAQTLAGDLLFAGDLEGWVRFANSLRIKAAIRISARQDPGNLIQSIVDEGRYLQTNAQNATFDFTAGPPNSFPFATARIGIFKVFLMSETAAEIFAAYSDPRQEVLFRPSAANNDFAGIRNGIDAASGITPDEFARPGLVWRENTSALDFNYLTAWETDFLLAEAVLKGYLRGTAKEYYDAGVIKAFAYWQTDLPPNHLSRSAAAWRDDRGLEQIITQKWIANIGNAYEGWAEWRRTGFPALKPVQASLNDGLYPVRMPYPNDEQALNFENYSAAAAATDNNSINVPVWWDVE
ncbi:MAG: SusD/RagB family nutrient-binding outer membrane lipoprotein, partial [Bacteroidota bacterium]